MALKQIDYPTKGMVKLNQSVKIWPNPVSNILNINSTNRTEFDVISINGAIVYKGEFIGGVTNIDLPSGMYFLKFQNNLVFKILVE